MRAHDELQALRRGIWRRLDRSIRALVGRPTAELVRYERRYRREVDAPGRPLTAGELIRALGRAELVVCGDYHTYRPAQVACLRLLQTMAESSSQVVLLVELALSAHQPHLDRYVDGRIDEATLLRRLDYPRTWGFAWTGYQRLFAYARANGIPIVGLNGPGTALDATLTERDRWAAEVIARTAAERPDARLLVLAGDLHLAEPHLPAEVRRALAARGLTRRTATVFQNADDLYWRLAASGLEADAVELRPGVYCLFSGTPWAKLESYLSWLEGGDDPHPSGAGGGDTTLDYADRIDDLARRLGEFLGLPRRGAEDVLVVSPGDPSFLADLASDPRLASLVPHLRASAVFLVPRAQILYVARLDLDHAAQGAAALVVDRAWRAGHEAEDEPEELLAGAGAFFARAYRQALVAFGARLLDPVGRPPESPDAEASVQALLVRYQQLVGSSLRDGRAELLPASAWEDDLRLHLAVSTAVGAAAGEILYARFAAGGLDRDGARALFHRVPAPGTAALAFRELAGQKHPERVRSRYRAAGSSTAVAVA